MCHVQPYRTRACTCFVSRAAIPSTCLYLLPLDGRRCWYFYSATAHSWLDAVKYSEGIDGTLLADNDTELFNNVRFELVAYPVVARWWTGLRRHDLDTWIWNNDPDEGEMCFVLAAK